MAGFHDASWPDALSIVLSFDDERLRTFRLRLVYFGSRSAQQSEWRSSVN
jgi:exodeoxyribonuclease-1